VLAALSASLGAAPAPTRALEPSSTDSWYVMDREGWLKTADARLVRTTYDLSTGPNLLALPYDLGAWHGEDWVITNDETFPTLDPDWLVYRGYRRGEDHVLVFSVVGGTKGQSFHHPLVCYQWANWRAEDRGTETIAVGDANVVLRSVVGYDPDGPAQVD